LLQLQQDFGGAAESWDFWSQCGAGTDSHAAGLISDIPQRRHFRPQSPITPSAPVDKMQIGTHFLTLAAAFALAIPIGWDREKKARSAGLRTFPLMALASCGFVQASEKLLVDSPDGMAKVIEGLITAIGFIGGGAILSKAVPYKAPRRRRVCGPRARSASRSGSAVLMWRSRSPCLRS
jgi:hypothetical protein